MKRHRRGSERGFMHLTTTLEAAAVLVWFVVLILGEKVVGDATLARRVTEIAAAQAAVKASSSYCRDELPAPITVGGVESVAAGSVVADGAPDPGSFVQIIAALNLGAHPTLAVHADGFRAVVSEAQSTTEAAPAPLKGGGHTFVGQRKLACMERSVDSPQTSISSYRTSTFDANIKAW